MSYLHDYATQFELSVLYHNAVAACCNASVSFDEEQVDLGYIKHKLYSALYDMTDFLISRMDVAVPSALDRRVAKVQELYGSRYKVPAQCEKLLERDKAMDQNTLEIVCCSMDLWFSTRCAEFGKECLSGAHIHSFVG